MGPSLFAVGEHEYKAINGLLAKIWLRVSPLVCGSTEWSPLLFPNVSLGLLYLTVDVIPTLGPWSLGKHNQNGEGQVEVSEISGYDK